MCSASEASLMSLGSWGRTATWLLLKASMSVPCCRHSRSSTLAGSARSKRGSGEGLLKPRPIAGSNAEHWALEKLHSPSLLPRMCALRSACRLETAVHSKKGAHPAGAGNSCEADHPDLTPYLLLLAIRVLQRKAEHRCRSIAIGKLRLAARRLERQGRLWSRNRGLIIESQHLQLQKPNQAAQEISSNLLTNL